MGCPFHLFIVAALWVQNGVDVLDGGAQILYHTHGEDEVQIFGRPVVLGGEIKTGGDLAAGVGVGGGVRAGASARSRGGGRTGYPGSVALVAGPVVLGQPDAVAPGDN